MWVGQHFPLLGTKNFVVVIFQVGGLNWRSVRLNSVGLLLRMQFIVLTARRDAAGLEGVLNP